jgi:hypothetical protein
MLLDMNHLCMDCLVIERASMFASSGFSSADAIIDLEIWFLGVS